jgi:hypothetical protein
MKKGLWIAFALCTAIFMESCLTTHSVSIDTLYPSATYVSKNLQHIVLVYNISDFSQNGDEKTTASLLDTVFAHHYLTGVYDELNETPRFVPANKIIYLPLKQQSYKRVLDSICNTYDADGILLLSQYQWKNSLSKAPNYIIDIAQFYASQVVSVQSEWKIYDYNWHTLTNSYFQNDTSYWEGYGNSAQEASQQLPVLQVAVPSALYAAGKKLAQHYAPYWVSVKRFYYETSNKRMKQAAEMAETGDWKGAATIWSAIANNPKSSQNLKARSTFNMALAAETTDDLEAALEWAAKSYLILPDEYTKSYIDILEHRKKLKEKIEGQLPSDN